MSYLLDKKIQRKKFSRIALLVAVLIILIYFRNGLFNGFSSLGQFVFRPVLVVGDNVGAKFRNLGSYFLSKNSLSIENENLKSRIAESEADRANYASVLADNVNLKETLGRKDTKVSMVLSAILAKPNQSPYDTLVIDAGTNQGIKIGNTVFVLGNIPIGRVALAYDNYSKIILFSSPGEKTQVVITGRDIFLELVGRGGGNFEMIIPRDLTLLTGDQVVLPGINSYVVALVESIISDPRNPETKALLKSPVNIQELKFVEVGQ